MLSKIEDFLLNKFAGKIIARGAVILGGIVVGKAASAHITLDQTEVIAAFTAGANWIFEWFKARRMKNPSSPAVQTDLSKVTSDPEPKSN